ncbi:MAG: AraC family transcriptional regulator [Pseudomonadota bacterium]|nr:AraC family transcriptional regulator [Pseudomonadota bacterium]
MEQASDLRLVPMQSLAKGGRWRVEAMRSYSVDQLLWFTRGQGRLIADGITRGYGAHNVIFLPAGTMHAFELGPQVYGTAVFFPTNHGLEVPEKSLHLRIRDARDQAEINLILDNLQREIEGDRPARRQALTHHAGLLSVWLERQRLDHDDALAASDAARRLVRRFSALVETRFHTGDSVRDYAKALGVTSTHLTRVCKETCGRTASEFLSDRKISEARRLLADTGLPIKDIASGLGFASAAYFTRSFQAHTGNPPSLFRESTAPRHH